MPSSIFRCFLLSMFSLAILTGMSRTAANRKRPRTVTSAVVSSRAFAQQPSSSKRHSKANGKPLLEVCVTSCDRDKIAGDHQTVLGTIAVTQGLQR